MSHGNPDISEVTIPFRTVAVKFNSCSPEALENHYIRDDVITALKELLDYIGNDVTVFKDDVSPWFHAGHMFTADKKEDIDASIAKAETLPSLEQVGVNAIVKFVDKIDKTVANPEASTDDIWRVSCALVYVYVVYRPDSISGEKKSMLTPFSNFIREKLARLCPSGEIKFHEMDMKAIHTTYM